MAVLDLSSAATVATIMATNMATNMDGRRRYDDDRGSIESAHKPRRDLAHWGFRHLAGTDR